MGSHHPCLLLLVASWQKILVAQTHPPFQKAKMGIGSSSELTPEEIFKKFDKNGNNTIEKKEIQKLLVKQVEARVEAIFANPDFNPDKDNKIKKDDFMAVMVRNPENMKFFNRMCKIEMPVREEEPETNGEAEETPAEETPAE